MAYTTIDDPEKYFQVKTYTGSGSIQAVTFDGTSDMQPDFIWIKNVDYADHHKLVDSVRWTDDSDSNQLKPNGTNGEGNQAIINSFNSDGFTLSTGDRGWNSSDGDTFVAWCLKETADAGFDIVTYTGNGSARTISHSLSAVPHFILAKRLDANGNSWVVYHKGVDSSAPEDYTLALDSTATRVNETLWNDTAPTSSVFSVGTAAGINGNTNTYVAYCFAPKQGFSKFGSYIGNGNADGPFVYTGFRPSFVLAKNATVAGQHWFINDDKRGLNGGSNWIKADYEDAQLTNLVNCDLLSNGFKLRNNNDIFNDSGETFVYAAFAHSPFVNSNGVPNNAR